MTTLARAFPGSARSISNDGGRGGPSGGARVQGFARRTLVARPSTDRAEGPIEAIDFHQVERKEQSDQAAALVREYLEWLNERVKRDYGLEFDVDAMVEFDLPDPDEFRPPDGRFYLVRYGDAVAGVGCLGELEDGVGEIRRINAPRQIDRNRRMLRVGLLFLRGLARMNTSMALRCRSSRR